MIRARLRRRKGDGDPEGDATEFVEIDPAELSGIFAAPQWLRDLGLMAWLLVGVAAFLVGAIWLLTLTQTIVLPVITAGIMAAVLSPMVGYLERHRVPRGAATAIVFLLIVAAGALVDRDDPRRSRRRVRQPQRPPPERRGQDSERPEGSRRQLELRLARDRRRGLRPDIGIPRVAGRPRQGAFGARVARRVPVLHVAQPRLPARRTVRRSGGGPSVTSASRRDSPTRSRVASSPRCGATSWA